MARLATHVHVPDSSGTYHVFGPADEVPDWAAAVITNPAAWSDAPDDRTDADGDGSTALDTTPDESWKVADLREYADNHGIDLADAKRKDEILALIAAGRNGDDGDGTGSSADD